MLFDEHKATNDIIQRLRDQVQDVAVSDFPGNPEEAFKTLTHAVGEICVRYYNSQYTDPVANPEGVLVQQRAVFFQCHIRARNWARTEKRQGALTIMGVVRAALGGWTLPDVADATMMSVAQDGFLDEQSGVFFAHVVMKCSVPFEAAA